MDIDFNNVQDQNLVDDSVIDDIENEQPAQAVGSVVHPSDTPPAAPAPPPVPPPPQPAAKTEPRVPTAQEILGDKLDEGDDEVPNLEATPQQEKPAEQAPDTAPSADIPEPQLAPSEEQMEEKQPEAEEEHLIAAPTVDETEEESTSEEQPEQPAQEQSADDQAPEQPAEEATASVEKDVAAADAESAVTDEQTSQEDFVAPTLGQGSGDDEELIGVKQQALEELSPLVDQLDLDAEQKFDTYMEILRASDDKTLVKPALEVAKQIEDESKRAQALLDVVNEVNYLTQDHNGDTE